MATYWEVPPMWKGQTVAILASGPSLTPEQVRRVVAAGLPVIAVNDCYKLAPEAAMVYAADTVWWRVNHGALNHSGIKATCNSSVEFKSVQCLRQTGVDGFDPDPRNIRTGGNGGYQAIHIAIQAGAKRVLLLGFDMTNKRGEHWFGKHKRPLRNTDENTYAIWRDRFRGLIGKGADIINCTPDSALACFPKMELEAAL